MEEARDDVDGASERHLERFRRHPEPGEGYWFRRRFAVTPSPRWVIYNCWLCSIAPIIALPISFARFQLVLIL